MVSLLSVVETGVEEVDSGVSVTVGVLCELPEMPRLVEDSVTEAGVDGAIDDELCDTVKEALLEATELTGETALVDDEAPGEG
jgi:hypothetical protein